MAESDEADIPECGPDDVEITVTWERVERGLSGYIEARNVSGERRRISGKPYLEPLGADGDPLGVDFAVTAELRRPPYAVLPPGGRARAPIWWLAWDGQPATARALVRWDGGGQVVDVVGPTQPGPPGPDGAPTNLSSSWFDPVE